jgi:hypothetical protein
MSDSPVRVELKGSHIDLNEYTALHKMMSSRGFQMDVVHPASKFLSAL